MPENYEIVTEFWCDDPVSQKVSQKFDNYTYNNTNVSLGFLKIDK